MNSSAPFRHIPLRRQVRDQLKHWFFWFYKFGTRLGVHILPAHYYASAPNIVELARSTDVWAKASTLPGIDINLDDQIGDLQRVCAPFENEFRNNTHYRHAVNQPFGSGRSRLFGYIEAQVLYAAIRYFKPKRVIELGSGVPTYCSYQALLKNRKDTGTDCQLTCIESNPIPLVRDLASSEENIELITQPVQLVSLKHFEQLRANDIVSIDSSHMVKAGSEVNYIMLELLPRLSAGVVVQIHDIYLPYDYERNVLQSFIHTNETSIVAAFLTCNVRFKILFSLSMLHYQRCSAMQAILPEYNPESNWIGMRQGTFDEGKHFPSSLWLEVKG